MYAHFAGKRVCEKMFRMIHSVGKWKLHALVNYYKLNQSLVPRVHGNSGKRPWNALSFEDTVRLKKFLSNYACSHATRLPGRYPGFKNYSIQLLESHITKKMIHDLYTKCCTNDNKRSLQYSLFADLWAKLVPYIIIAKPRTDLCTDCQQNNTLILRSANNAEGHKQDRLAWQQEHLYWSEREHLYYRLQCKNAKNEWRNALDQGRPPNFTHISFDFAQQLQFPAPPDQPGGFFFDTAEVWTFWHLRRSKISAS